MKQKFKYFSLAKSLSSEEAKEVLSLNLPYYEQKLQHELDLAFDLLKIKAPWLNPVSWLFVLALLVCAGSAQLRPLSDGFMALSLVAGLTAVGIVIWLLFKCSRLIKSKLVKGENTPASLIASQIPMCLIHVQLAIGVFTSGLLTLSILSIITSLSIFVIAVSTQLTAMSNVILQLDMKVLDQNEVREFIKNTAPLYSQTSKAWLLSEAMEGMRLSLSAIQFMQCQNRPSASNDPT